MSNDTNTDQRPATSQPSLTMAGRMRQEIAKRIDTVEIELRSQALRLAIDSLRPSDDGAGVVTLAEAYYQFLTAGQVALDQ